MSFLGKKSTDEMMGDDFVSYSSYKDRETRFSLERLTTHLNGENYHLISPTMNYKKLQKAKKEAGVSWNMLILSFD